MHLILNSAGEIESDRWTPRANLIEAAAVYAALQASLWLLIGYLGRSAGMTAMELTGKGVLFACLVYMALVAPMLHGEGAGGMGLPRPLSFWMRLRQLHAPARLRMLVAAAVVAGGVVMLFAPVWPYLLVRLGVRFYFPEVYDVLVAGTTGQLSAGIAALVLFFLVSGFLVRWDNFASALPSLTFASVVAWAGVVGLAAAFALDDGDWSRFRDFRWFGDDEDALFTRASFYLLWAMLQQHVFLGYFNSRLRKGIAFRRYGPFSARMLTALLGGAMFGLVHLPTFPLVGVTFFGGILMSWYFQSDGCRNLFLVGASHGVAGTLYALLVPGRMLVGPWN